MLFLFLMSLMLQLPHCVCQSYLPLLSTDVFVYPVFALACWGAVAAVAAVVETQRGPRTTKKLLNTDACTPDLVCLVDLSLSSLRSWRVLLLLLMCVVCPLCLCVCLCVCVVMHEGSRLVCLGVACVLGSCVWTMWMVWCVGWGDDVISVEISNMQLKQKHNDMHEESNQEH